MAGGSKMAAGSEAPPFWWEDPDWRAWALAPFSALYGLVAGFRLRAAPRVKVAVPVLCVGNFTVGGEGKTPVAIALGRAARRARHRPGFLSRGHGGSVTRPHLVDAAGDPARLVGDEPLLLAEHAPTVVTPDRAAGAARLIEEGCDFIIMDDGFQSACIHIDYALIVVDARRGIGNGHVIPAGPMRAPLVDQLRFADAVVRMGEGEAADETVRMTARAGKPVFDASAKPRRPRSFKGGRFLAFAGIGNPEKFFDTLRKAGGDVVISRAFPDHHLFTVEEADELTAQAAAEGLELVTTTKDLARLRHGAAELRDFAEKLRVLEIDATFAVPDTPAVIVEETVSAWRERTLGVPTPAAAAPD